MTVCLSLHNVLAVILRRVLLFYVLSESISLNFMGYFINRIRETLQVRFQTSQPFGCIQCFPLCYQIYFRCISVAYLL